MDIASSFGLFAFGFGIDLECGAFNSLGGNISYGQSNACFAGRRGCGIGIVQIILVIIVARYLLCNQFRLFRL